MRWMLIVAGLAACGGPPILSGLPRPDPKVVAGLAAAGAAAATVMDPNAAARIREAGKQGEPEPTTKGREVVPPDVLERLDAEESDTTPTSEPASAPAR
jgi:hypothetical protein